MPKLKRLFTHREPREGISGVSLSLGGGIKTGFHSQRIFIRNAFSFPPGSWQRKSGSSNGTPIEWPYFSNQLTAWNSLLPWNAINNFFILFVFALQEKRKEKGENG